MQCLLFHDKIECKSTKGDAIPLLLFYGEDGSKSMNGDIVLFYSLCLFVLFIEVLLTVYCYCSQL